VSVVLAPDLRSLVVLRAILKSCGILPAFLTRNVTWPRRALAGRSWNLNSVALTETFVFAAVAGGPADPSAIGAAAAAITMPGAVRPSRRERVTRAS